MSNHVDIDLKLPATTAAYIHRVAALTEATPEEVIKILLASSVTRIAQQDTPAGPAGWLPFNTNVLVRVKLTTFGLEVLKKVATDPLPPDVEGYNYFRMWELMSFFGEAMEVGGDSPFEKNIVEVIAEQFETIAHPETKHPSHETRMSDASTFDEVCVKCGATDIALGGWGELANPCKG